VSAAERDLHAEVSKLSVTVFTLLNKADYLDQGALAEATDFTRRVLGGGRVYSLSARAALDGGDPGFDAFASDFRSYLAGNRVTDLRLSAIARARRIAGSLLDEVALTRRAAKLAAGDAAERVAQFGERLTAVAVRGCDAAAVVNAESARQLTALNHAAEADGARLGRQLVRQLGDVLDGELRDAAAAEIERLGRERLVAITLEGAGTWRDLQYRLAEATRVMARVLAQRYADSTGRMQSALLAAEELRKASCAEATERERALSARSEALQRILARLDDKMLI
jgi:hypothetical protein